VTAAGYLTLGALAAAIGAFAAGRWRPDAVAVLALLALILSGVLDPRAAFAGFGSPVLVAVGAVFVVSTGLERTGIAAALGRRLVRLAGANEIVLILSLGGVAGLLSGIMNSIGAMAVLLPAAMATAREAGVSPSRLLLPLALGTRLGGNLTLIAGPSNLIASRILADHGLRPLGFFEFLPIGGTFLIAGLAFIALIGRQWLPSAAPAEHRRRKLTELYRLGERLFEIRVAPDSPLAGKTLEEAALGSAWGVTVLNIIRHRRQVVAPSPGERLLPGDRLLVQGRLEEFLYSGRLNRDDVRERDPVEVDGLESPEVRVVEVILAPRSSLVGKTLREVDFREKYGVNVLAIWREGRPRRTGLVDLPVQLGDALLVQGRRDRLRLLGNDPDFLVLEPEEALPLRPARAPWAVGAVALMILLSTAGVEIAVAALAAAVVVVAAGCLSAEEIYQFVDWRSLVFIGAMLPFSTALATTGAADQLVSGVLTVVGGGAIPALAALLAVGIVANQVMPSVAATVLLAPIAVQIASHLGGNPHAFVMAVIAATGTTFTPISNPVNLLVMGPGGYRLADYVRIGVPLGLLLGGLSLVVIPLAWPLR